MSTVISMLMLTAMVVMVYDLTDAPQRLFKPFLFHLLKGWRTPYRDYECKPLECSLCCSIYVNFIYLLCAHSLTIPYMAIMFALSILTPVIKDAIMLIKDMAQTIINGIYFIINRINSKF